MRGISARKTENLFSRVISFRHLIRKNRWLSRGTPQLLSTHSRRNYMMRRTQWSGLPSVLRPRPRASCLYSVLTIPVGHCCSANSWSPLRSGSTSARVFALSFVVVPGGHCRTFRAASALRFVNQPLRNESLLSATLATIQLGVELISCIAPSFLASSPAAGGTRHNQRINKQPGKPGTQPVDAADRANHKATA